VVGYSGGKDSTAVLQLVWLALSRLNPEERTKAVQVISTDTLVENPIVASWVTNSLKTMDSAAKAGQLPISSHRLTPSITDTFWVNLIGKGYPAPRPKFRWCTERLKIKPSNAFITNVVRQNGEVILVLGTRKAESSVRGYRMQELEKKRLRDRLSPNASLPNSLVFSPIEEWSNDDVWLFLMQVPNPWGHDNKALLTMYQGASPDGECPLVVDSSTPSCGDSRFGCWVCTLVDQDKSMHAMIQNDQEKEWMLPLLELRNELDVPDDRHLRDFRRMSGEVQLFHDKPIPGPYVQAARERWLAKVLQAQKWVREHGPEHVRDIDLISIDELNEIRRIWVLEKHELEDNLPRIYREITGQSFAMNVLDENLVFNREDMEVLREIVGEDSLHFELVRELLSTARRFRGKINRAGLYEAFEKAIRKGFYSSEEDATTRALQRQNILSGAHRKAAEQLPLLPEIKPIDTPPES
jgi:DNA sulfur modification protein DndC